MSITLKSNVACVSCGTTAMRRASSRRVSCCDRPPVEQHAAAIAASACRPACAAASSCRSRSARAGRRSCRARRRARRRRAHRGSDVAAAPDRRTRRQSRFDARHRSCTVTTSSAQQPERCTCPLAAQRKRRAEQRRVRDDGVVLAALAARIDAEPREVAASISRRSGRPSQRLVEELGARRDDHRVGARRDPLFEQRRGRRSPTAARPPSGRRPRTSARPTADARRTGCRRRSRA